MSGQIQMRSGIRRLFREIETCRTIALVARRQWGKTTGLSQIALFKMMRQANHTVVFGSAKLNLSREIVRKEASIIEAAIRHAIATSVPGQVTMAEADTGRALDLGQLTADDFAAIFEAQRLEFRYNHSRIAYSRTKVVALRDDTVGDTGDLMLDEVGRVRGWRDVWEAVSPIIAANPDFRCLITTTPPPDSAHYSFDQLAPPPGMTFEPNPEGNLYESIGGVTVLRVDAWDAYLDGTPLYDDRTATPLSPDASRARARDKDSWDRNYGCAFLEAGSSAMSYSALATAQAKGAAAGCIFAQDELPPGYERLFSGGGDIGIGLDPATTEGDTSNPSGLCVCQRDGEAAAARLMLSFKASDPNKPKEILRELVARLKPRAIAIDATSERYFARDIQDEFEPGVTVYMVVASRRCEELDAPDDPPVNWKTYLGHAAVMEVEDRTAILPPGQAVLDDFRLVRRWKGGYDNVEDSATGAHGDLFDGYKHARFALTCDLGTVEITAVDLHSAPATNLPPAYRAPIVA